MLENSVYMNITITLDSRSQVSRQGSSGSNECPHLATGTFCGLFAYRDCTRKTCAHDPTRRQMILNEQFVFNPNSNATAQKYCSETTLNCTIQ